MLMGLRLDRLLGDEHRVEPERPQPSAERGQPRRFPGLAPRIERVVAARVHGTHAEAGPAQPPPACAAATSAGRSAGHPRCSAGRAAAGRRDRGRRLRGSWASSAPAGRPAAGSARTPEAPRPDRSGARSSRRRSRCRTSRRGSPTACTSATIQDTAGIDARRARAAPSDTADRAKSAATSRRGGGFDPASSQASSPRPHPISSTCRPPMSDGAQIAPHQPVPRTVGHGRRRRGRVWCHVS